VYAMDHNYLPIDKIQAVTKITNRVTLDDIETSDLQDHII
jgi:hypothetical protein